MITDVTMCSVALWLRFFGLVQLGYRERLKVFIDMQECKKDDELELEVDMSEEKLSTPVTPPADAPATPKMKPRTMSRVISRGRQLSRHGSGMLAESTSLKDNPFTTVPPSFKPPQQSPTRKGTKREREKGPEKVKEGGSGEGEAKEKEEAMASDSGVLNLELGMETGGISSVATASPPRKKVKP